MINPKPESEPTFTADDAVGVQRRLREELGLPPETFPAPAFIGMISDEIEQLRNAGKTDDEIAAVVNGALGRSIDPALIARYYAAPEKRRHP